MDPDEVEIDRRKMLVERQRAAEIELVRQRIQPLLQAAKSGSFGISSAAGQELISAIHRCKDGLERSERDLSRIQQATKLGTSPDAVAMTRFNTDVAAGGTDSAITSIAGLHEILEQMETTIHDAMERYRQLDESSAGNITSSGN